MQHTLKTGILFLAALAAACGDSGGGGGDLPDAAPPDAVIYVPGQPLTLSVGGAFPDGTALRDAYSGATVTVAAGGMVTVTPAASGVVLLERQDAVASPFRWHDVTVYHAMVDRYVNGDTSNDTSYGRKKDGQMEVGTWHGGDWKGLATKLDYLRDLGVSALWISPIVEQVHGWVSGGSVGDFKHYGYHGYWALDFTRLDKNLGGEADLQALVDGAHQRGIRVLCDVVLNHPGYATGADLVQVLPEVFNDKTGAAFMTYDQTATTQYASWNNLVDYHSQGWKNWWSPKWIRSSDFPDFPRPGTTEQTRQLNFLPDFITEGTGAADTPVLFTRKTDTGFAAQPNFTVRQYLVKWHTDWVRRFGFDGFRVDTVKNVDRETFKALKEAGLVAQRDWKTQNPSKALDDAPFWMVAEDFGHGVMADSLYSDGGFDSVLNFAFQDQIQNLLTVRAQLVEGAADLELIYARQASAVVDSNLGILSYISSHDTKLFFDFFKNVPLKQQQAGTALLLAPGGIEIYYGDESGRRAGPALSDAQQATRSDMNFSSTDESIFQHWQKLATFRRKHAAVGEGVHRKLDSMAGTYAFSRKTASDTVVVILTGSR